MKNIKSRQEFINEQLFGDAIKKITDLLGFTQDLKDPGESPISGTIKSNVSGDKGKNIEALLAAMKRHGITNPYTQIAILGVVGKECGYIPKDEIGYGGTSNERIRKIFGKRVSNLSDSELNAIKSNDVKFFDLVYGPDDPTGKGKQYGNTSQGDGYKYRGRGFNGITFKAIYQGMQKLLDKNGKLERKVDIVSNPDVLNDIDVAAEVAVLYFLDRASNKHMAQKYGVSEINGFKDQDTALKAMANANAGWGKDVEGSEGLRKATELASNFKIDSSGSASMA